MRVQLPLRMMLLLVLLLLLLLLLLWQDKMDVLNFIFNQHKLDIDDGDIVY